jgi:8-oxo-dGTP pyrophosphatase MutT (NUDIX family)
VATAKRSAGFVVVHDAPAQRRFLILRAYKLWDFPKGLVEPGETALETALRETREETGIDDLDLAWGEVFAETAPYSGGKVARYYVARTQTEAVVLSINPTLGRPEHHEYRWVGFAQLHALLPPRLHPIVAWLARLGVDRA